MCSLASLTPPPFGRPAGVYPVLRYGAGMTILIEAAIYKQTSFTTKYFLEKVRSTCCRVFPDFLLFLAYHME